ncbi:hypothetical protein SAMN06265218_12417 [Fodinibius sediminis]|uniref:Uncharacterized protein n=1 Tax=Fodinibius sediminis TaxID=1214077 RepID=A0A521F606_9BACT|nr:hypothetical protein SAMN06265218_12417 [Fodinibius sediminis]
MIEYSVVERDLPLPRADHQHNRPLTQLLLLGAAGLLHCTDTFRKVPQGWQQ